MILFFIVIFFFLLFSIVECQYSISPQFKLSTLPQPLHTIDYLTISFFCLATLKYLFTSSFFSSPPLLICKKNDHPCLIFLFFFGSLNFSFRLFVPFLQSCERETLAIFTGIFYSNWCVIIIYVLSPFVIDFLKKTRSTEAGNFSNVLWNFCCSFWDNFMNFEQKNSRQKLIQKSLIFHSSSTNQEMKNVCVYSTSLMISVDDEFC